MVCFFVMDSNVVYLEFIERRDDLGGKTEHPKEQQKYTEYITELKKVLLGEYEPNNC